MRKLLPLAVGAALVFAPLTIAFADTTQGLTSPTARQTLDAPLTSDERAELHREAKRALKTARKRANPEPEVKIPPILDKIAQCESHGDPRAIGGGGMYRGKYQFNVGTWQSVGGKGDPAKASEAEQDKRAAILLERSGPGQWPVCSR